MAKVLLASPSRSLSSDLREKVFPLLPGVPIVQAANDHELAVHLQDDAAKVLFLDPDWHSGGGAIPLGPRHPPIIMISTHERAAMAAFRMGALDYLISPVEPLFLKESLCRAGLLNLASCKQHPLRRRDDRLPVAVGRTIRPTLVRDILLFASIGNICQVHTANFYGTVPRTLKTFEEQLDPHIFHRANRAQIFNMHQVASYNNLPDGRIRVEIPTLQPIHVSRRQARQLRLVSGWK